MDLPYPEMIDASAQRVRKQRIISAQFGDGYSQEIPDGVNSILDTWSISWQNLNATERLVVVSTLDSVGSTDVLTWTPPGSSTARAFKMTNQGFTETYIANLYNISLQLREVNPVLSDASTADLFIDGGAASTDFADGYIGGGGAGSPAPAPVIDYTFQANIFGDLVYQTQYEAAMASSPDAISNLGTAWDQVGPQPTNVTYSSTTKALFGTHGTQNIALSRNIPNQDNAYDWEIVIGNAGTCYVGLAINSGWRSPDDAYGYVSDPFGYIAYGNDGTVSYKVPNGSITTTSAPTFTAGDVIGFGLWYDYPQSTFLIFKNGVQVGSFFVDGNDSQHCQAYAGVV